MAIRKKREPRARRLAFRPTKKSFSLRHSVHWGRVAAIALAVVAIVALALLWGSHLKTESDAYHEALEMGAWTLDPEMTISHPVSVPDIRAISIKPEGNVGDILIAGDHEGIIMTFTVGNGELLYRSSIGDTAGLSAATEAISLEQDVERVQKRGLRVICAFTITCFHAPDTATYAYLRGLELALLRECAEAGVDELLLFGLPTGTDNADNQTVEFLTELRNLLAGLPTPPALGVALPPQSYATDQTYIPTDAPESDLMPGISEESAPLYAGNITPSRILNVCDYLAMDMRNLTPDEVSATLPHIRYTYVRFSLRLLIDKNSPTAVEDVLSHGFERVFEMNPPAEAGNSPD